MFLHMNKRTTLVLDSTLYAELKARAVREGRTLADVIERALRQGLERRGAARRPRLKLPSYDLGPFLVDPSNRTAWDRPHTVRGPA